MANPHRGEIDVHVGDRRYRLSMSSNAFANLEEASGLNPAKVSEALKPDNLTMRTIKTILLSALQDHQPDATEQDVVAILKLQSLSETSQLIGALLNRSVDVEEEGGARPTQEGSPSPPPTGTGNGSLKAGSH